MPKFLKNNEEPTVQTRRLSSTYYKISKKGYPDSYLFGTVHVPLEPIPSLNNLHPELSEGFKQAQQVFVEAFQDEISKRNNKLELKIKDVFTTESLKFIKKYFKQFDFSEIYMANGLRLSDIFCSQLPLEERDVDWLNIMVTYSYLFYIDPTVNQTIKNNIGVYSTIENCSEKNIDPKWHLDNKIEKLARESNKKVIALDSKSFMFSSLQDVSDKHIVTIKAIIEGKCNLKTNSDFALELVSQNVRLLKVLQSYEFQAESPFIGHHEDEEKRNVLWVKKLLPKLKIPSFIAVGYYHLAGEKGLIKLLEKRGFAVIAMECPRESLAHERQFANVMSELKSKRALIFSRKLLRSVSPAKENEVKSYNLRVKRRKSIK